MFSLRGLRLSKLATTCLLRHYDYYKGLIIVLINIYLVIILNLFVYSDD